MFPMTSIASNPTYISESEKPALTALIKDHGSYSLLYQETVLLWLTSL